MAERTDLAERSSKNAPGSPASAPGRSSVPRAPNIPSEQQILDFVAKAEQPVGKREITRHFSVRGREKIALKALLGDMAERSLVNLDPARSFRKPGQLPKVTIVRVVALEGSHVWAVPDQEPDQEPDAEAKLDRARAISDEEVDEETDKKADESLNAALPPLPRLRVVQSRGKQEARQGERQKAKIRRVPVRALVVGERILARIEACGDGHIAYPMKHLRAADETIIGVLVADEERGGMLMLRPVDKRARYDLEVTDKKNAHVGELVRAELRGRGWRTRAKVIERIGNPFTPRSLSMIAISKYELPHIFDAAVLDEASRLSSLGLSSLALADESVEDLRHLPIIAIDPVDARDHDDAVWALSDDDPQNEGGWRVIVAIADVSFYVRPGSALDAEARRRGNSVYFPDQVVPMLPEELSADLCSLKAGEDRRVIACHLVVDRKGRVTHWRFARACVRLRANLSYEEAQAAIDIGSLSVRKAPPGRENTHGSDQRGSDQRGSDEILSALRHLWACWQALAKARSKRAPLEIDLPEPQVVLDEAGDIRAVHVRDRLDAHRLIEDYMIAANVAAAKALEAKKSPLVYRIHEPPNREKLLSLADYLASFGQSFALGQTMTPTVFNRVIAAFGDNERLPAVQEAILRTQTQAYYGSANAGHFGLALGSYAHFTSPIRRYADLLVHRSLVDAYTLEMAPGNSRKNSPNEKNSANKKNSATPAAGPEKTGLAKSDRSALGMARVGEVLSGLERRAVIAERETLDRYIAAWLENQIGALITVRITGVQPFGFFATVDGLGGDGLLHVSMMGEEPFFYDESRRTLESKQGETVFSVGLRLKVRLLAANPISGGLRFGLPNASLSQASAKAGIGQKRREKRSRNKGKEHAGKLPSRSPRKPPSTSKTPSRNRRA